MGVHGVRRPRAVHAVHHPTHGLQLALQLPSTRVRLWRAPAKAPGLYPVPGGIVPISYSAPRGAQWGPASAWVGIRGTGPAAQGGAPGGIYQC